MLHARCLTVTPLMDAPSIPIKGGTRGGNFHLSTAIYFVRQQVNERAADDNSQVGGNLKLDSHTL